MLGRDCSAKLGSICIVWNRDCLDVAMKNARKMGASKIAGSLEHKRGDFRVQKNSGGRGKAGGKGRECRKRTVPGAANSARDVLPPVLLNHLVQTRGNFAPIQPVERGCEAPGDIGCRAV